MAASAALQLSASSVPGQLTLRTIHDAATATSDSSLNDDAALFGQLWSLGESVTRWDYGFTLASSMRSTDPLTRLMFSLETFLPDEGLLPYIRDVTYVTHNKMLRSS